MGIHEQKIMQLMKAHNDEMCYIGEDFAEDFEDDDFLQEIQTIEIVGNELFAYDENDDMINKYSSSGLGNFISSRENILW